MSTIEEQLKNGWAEEQRLVRQIRGDQSRLREVRKDRIRLLTDLCTNRPLLDHLEAKQLAADQVDAASAGSELTAESRRLREELVESGVDPGLAPTLALLLAGVSELYLRNDLIDDISESEHPEEWILRLQTLLSRQHLIEPIDLTSEYAIPYLTEVSQRANDLFAAINEWRRHQEVFTDPILFWDQWFEAAVSVKKSTPNQVYGEVVHVLYRYGDLTSKADGVETVECDFLMRYKDVAPLTVTRVLGPASRSVGGESIRDQIRVIAQAIYEDACREAREMAEPKPTKAPKKAKKGGSQ